MSADLLFGNFYYASFKMKGAYFMSEKTYDAIYKIAKQTESDVLMIWAGHLQITGLLLDCGDSKCLSDIVTLQDVTVKCHKHKENNESDNGKHFKWLNIPACKIDAFTFKCCMLDE